MKTTVLAILICALLPISVLAAWHTMGGGSLRNGQADFVGPDDATLRWTYNDPCLFAGPIYTDGDYAAMMRFNTIDFSPIVCLDVNTGAELWSVDLPGPSTRSLPVGFRDGQIYALGFQETNNDTLYALDPADGSILWIAETGLKQGIIASAAFANNGDLIVNAKDPNGSYLLTRLDHTDGSIVWTTPRVCAVIGGSEHVCVYGEKVYGWDGGIGQVEFTAWDLTTGTELYSISLPGDGDQEIPFSVHDDSAIYIIRDGGDLFRVEDTGTGFEIVWQVPVNFGPIPPIGGHFATLDNGDVVVTHATVVKRHAYATGDVLATSAPLTSGTYLGYPRFAVDDNNTIYCATGTSDGRLYALDPATLAELWSYPLNNNHYAGAAVANNGDIISASSGGAYCFEGVSGGTNPLVTLTLTPHNTPINVPRGGSFSYGIALTTGDLPMNRPGDVWLAATLPNGSLYGPVARVRLQFEDNMDLSVANVTQPIPQMAPVGDYTWHAYAGIFPNFVAAQDEFAFTVTANTVASSTAPQMWTMSGSAPSELANAFDGTTVTAGENEPLAVRADLDVQVYPNPANAATTITVSVPTAQRVTVAISDILGRTVDTIDAGVIHPGGQRLHLELDHYPSGTYLVRVDAGSAYTQTKRLVVVK